MTIAQLRRPACALLLLALVLPGTSLADEPATALLAAGGQPERPGGWVALRFRLDCGDVEMSTRADIGLDHRYGSHLLDAEGNTRGAPPRATRTPGSSAWRT